MMIHIFKMHFGVLFLHKNVDFDRDEKFVRKSDIMILIKRVGNLLRVEIGFIRTECEWDDENHH